MRNQLKQVKVQTNYSIFTRFIKTISSNMTVNVCRKEKKNRYYYNTIITRPAFYKVLSKRFENYRRRVSNVLEFSERGNFGTLRINS